MVQYEGTNGWHLQLVDLVLGHHRVVAKVGHDLGPAAGAEAPRGAIGGVVVVAAGAGHRAESHAAVFGQGV